MPGAIPRNQPVLVRSALEHIVERHAEEAAFLWTLRDAAAEAPHYKRHHLALLEERVEAHVDGLRVSGDVGRRITTGALDAHPEEPGEMFAAAILALESGELACIAPIVSLAEAATAARRGLIGAIAWCRPALEAPIARAWDCSARGFERYLASCAYSVHRARPPGLADRIEDEDALVRARALRLAGEIGQVEQRGACLHHLGDPDPECRFWAAWSAVLLGDRGAALRFLEAQALAGSHHQGTALEVAVRAMGAEQGKLFVGRMSAEARLHRAVVVAVGHLGDAAAVPWLIERMERPELARVAGESFAMITGADLVDDNLECATAPKETLQVPSDEPADEEVAEDPEGDLPWPDASLVRGWWDQEGRRFAAGIRHLAGHSINPSTCARIWQDGFQRQRRAAAYEASLTGATEPLRNWRGRS